MNATFNIIISAIFDDGFPGKAVADIYGKPMMQHVFEAAMRSGAGEVVLATDSPRVGMAAEEFGATVCMITEDECRGYQVHADVIDKMGWGDDVVVVSLPADMPLMPSENIVQVASNLVNNDNVECATLYTLVNQAAAEAPETISMVVNNASHVMYMSRFALPHTHNDGDNPPYYKSFTGLVAGTAGLFRILKNLGAESMDTSESIEEIRLLYNEMTVHAEESVRRPGQRVFSEQDIEKVLQQLSPQT